MDQRKIKRLKELTKEHDHDFEQCQVEILNFIEAEDKAALDSEEAVFDEHVNCVSKIIEQLEDLVATTEPPRPHVSTEEWEVTSGLMRKQKRLRYLKGGIDKAYGTIRLLESAPDLDVCLVEKLKKDVNVLTKRLSDIVEDICHSRRMILHR